VSVLELVTPGVDTDMMAEVQRVFEGHPNTSNWDHVEPADWARKVADAIENDDEQLNPGGGEWLAKLAPQRLLDAAANAASTGRSQGEAATGRPAHLLDESAY